MNSEHFSRSRFVKLTFARREFDISRRVHSYLKIVTLAAKKKDQNWILAYNQLETFAKKDPGSGLRLLFLVTFAKN